MLELYHGSDVEIVEIDLSKIGTEKAIKTLRKL